MKKKLLLHWRDGFAAVYRLVVWLHFADKISAYLTETEESNTINQSGIVYTFDIDRRSGLPQKGGRSRLRLRKTEWIFGLEAFA